MSTQKKIDNLQDYKNTDTLKADDRPEPFLTKAPEFPVNTLPEPFRTYIIDLGSKTKMFLDYFGLGLLCLWSMIVGNRRFIKIKKGFVETALIWGILIGDVSAGKTHSLKQIMELILPLEMKEWSEYVDELHKYIDWKRKYDLMSKEEKASETLMPKPIEKRYRLEDTTKASVIEKLMENPRGFIVIQDELIGWLLSLGKKNSPDRSFWNAVWNSHKVVRVDRKSGKHENRNILIERPYIAMLGALIPDFLDEIRSDVYDDGLASRFLMVFPKSRKLELNFEDLDIKAFDAVSECFRKYKELKIEDEDFYVLLSEDAQDELGKWFDQNEAEIHDQSPPNTIKNVLGKMRSYICRIALVLHTMKEAADVVNENNGSISIDRMMSGETIRDAVKLIEYFKKHAFKAYDYQQRDEIHSIAEKILYFMQKNGTGDYKQSYIQQNCKWDRKTIKEAKLRPCLQLLEKMDHGIYEPENRIIFRFEKPETD